MECWFGFTFPEIVVPSECPSGLIFSWWRCYGLCHRHKLTKLAHSFLFCSCVCFCLYDPFNSISFHKFSRQLFAFSLCSSGLNSALLALSTMYLFMKVSLSPDVILCGWLGLKHQLTDVLVTADAESCAFVFIGDGTKGPSSLGDGFTKHDVVKQRCLV